MLALDTAMKEFEDLVEKAKQMPVEDKHFMYKGIPYPSIVTSLETLQALDNFEARADDILLVSYPKCGFNWMLHIVNSLAITAGTTKKGNEILPPLLEFRKPEKLQVLSSTPSQRILGTHLHPDNLPNSFFEKKAKILTMIRNPKDAAVSFYHFLHSPFIGFNYTWDEFFSIFMEGKGESIKRKITSNMSEEVKKTAKFFNFTLTEEQIQSICSKSTFKSMKENSITTHGKFGTVTFRKGDIGDWKNCLTEEQSKAVDLKFEKHLAGTKIGDLLKYDEYCK
uniref:Sulfotransferase n=1 Tax=Erpetoichthys calabaricus TaxID=27687 RepID=A0A8C4RXV2_ERPCA